MAGAGKPAGKPTDKPTGRTSRTGTSSSKTTSGAGPARTAAERRAKAQALRNAQIRRDRRRRILLVAAVVVVALGAIAGVTVGVVASRSGDDAPSAAGQVLPAAVTTADGAATAQKTAVPVDDTSGIDGVLAWDTAGYPAKTGNQADALEHQHVTGPVTYTVTPPVGGPHNGIWMNAGVYTDPVPTERAVHDMEHGAIWITYRSDLPAADVAALTAFVGRQSFVAEQAESSVSGQENRYMVLSPWAGSSLPSPIVLSAWGHQLRVDSASDARMQQFVDTFRHSQTYTPEYGAAVDGVPTGTGGVPATDGSKLPNPAGTAAG